MILQNNSEDLTPLIYRQYSVFRQCILPPYCVLQVWIWQLRSYEIRIAKSKNLQAKQQTI